ncbi:MAG: hypothetical protein ACR2QO_16775, partial [Acidimicrobiales bacterium]
MTNEVDEFGLAVGDGAMSSAEQMVGRIRTLVAATDLPAARLLVAADPDLRQLEVISLLAARADVADASGKIELATPLRSRAGLLAGTDDAIVLRAITNLVRLSYELG